MAAKGSTTPPATKTKDKKKNTRQPLSVFMAEIADKILRPKIDAVIDEMGAPESEAKLRERFNEKYKCTASADTFKNWMNLCGYSLQRAVTIVGRTPPPTEPAVFGTPVTNIAKPITGAAAGKPGG